MFRLLAESFDNRVAKKFAAALKTRSYTTSPKELQKLQRLLKVDKSELFLMDTPLPIAELQANLKPIDEEAGHTVYHINFASPHRTPHTENNRAYGKFYRSKINPAGPTVLVLPGWMTYREDIYYRSPLGTMLLDAGINYIFYSMPYHFARAPKGCLSGELAISGNLLLTTECLRQAIVECRTILHWLRAEVRPEKVGILGISLGGWVSSHLLHLEDAMDFAILMIPAINQQAALWETKIAAPLRRDILKSGIDAESYGTLFAPLDPMKYQPLLAPEKILIIRARYDQCVPARALNNYCDFLQNAQVRVYPHGHFSILHSKKPIKGITKFIRNQK